MSLTMVMYWGAGDSENEGRFILMVIPNRIYREVKVKINWRKHGKK
jgi:hypothetical protein